MIRKLLRHPRFRGTLRVAAFLSAANLTGTVFLLPQAQAEAEEAVKRSGLALLEQLGPALVSTPQQATINGQAMSLSSKTTALGLQPVLDSFEQHCRERSGGLAEAMQALPEEAAVLAKLPEELRDPSRWLGSRTLEPDGKSGQVACLTRQDSVGGFQGLLGRAQAFVESGDVSELGDPRYVVARRDEQAGTTHVLAMWTEGKFNIPEMFPEHGDAPGSDSRHVPRPPLSRRVLTAEIQGHPYALRMYDSKQSEAEVLAFYEAQLAPKGFHHHELPVPDGSELDLNEQVRAFTRDGVGVIVVTNQTPNDETGVTLIEMGSRGFAKATARVEGPLE